jgi:hypothetical protein
MEEGRHGAARKVIRYPPFFEGASMDVLRVGKSIKRITVLQADSSGACVPVVVFESRGRKKKSSRELRPAERMTVACGDVASAAAATYLRRHKRSNRRSRDGWLREMPNNALRAAGKGFRKGSGDLWRL